MSDEQARIGRFGQQHEPRSCGAERHRPLSTCPQCVPGTLRPFRAVKRYRGDQVVRAFAAADWCDVWQIQLGDISWPNSRRG